MPDGNSDSSSSLAARLAAGDLVADSEVDAQFPESISRLSQVHWTPVAVAQTAARFLVEGMARPRILDVGSGAGKFCGVAAATTGAEFVGVERRPHLVAVAEDFVARLPAAGVTFLTARMEDIDWLPYTGLYFYNPFGEAWLTASESIDDLEDRSWAAYVHYVRTTMARLYLMPTGTKVATYHGMGGPLPPGYRLDAQQNFPAGVLRCYTRIDPLLTRTPHPPEDMFDDVVLFGDKMKRDPASTDPTSLLDMPDMSDVPDLKGQP